ncbi:Kiwa anti-phage protein KwaB-like domain-containing protein [Paracidovorax avenae]
MQQNFASLRGFDFSASNIYLWVFKRSTTPKRFSSFYVQTDSNLNEVLLAIVRGEINRITEWANYTYLSETNENSCLALPIVGSDFEFLKNLVDRPEPDCRARSIKDLKNADGYVVKFVHDTNVVYAIKKSTRNWKTSYLKTHINLVFRNGELSAEEDNRFAIEKNFDFYAFEQTLFIASKRAFESSMQHRASYAQAFSGLQNNTAFSALFTNMQPVVDYIGTNSIQLRRMARIEERSLFDRPGFLGALQQVSTRRGWGLNFDPVTNQLIPCDQTIRTIMQVLLDHRLLSEVTDFIYDVPDATQV